VEEKIPTMVANSLLAMGREADGHWKRRPDRVDGKRLAKKERCIKATLHGDS